MNLGRIRKCSIDVDTTMQKNPQIYNNLVASINNTDPIGNDLVDIEDYFH